MKIVHIAPNAPYNEGWGYQDNLLPKYHVKLGHDVALIIRNEKHTDKGIVKTECEDYISPDGFRVIRRESHGGWPKKAYFEKMDVYEMLKEIKPDFIFFHGLVNRAIYDAVKYKIKINQSCVIVQDNHLDYNIGPNPISLKQKILRAYYRHIHARSKSYVTRIYGVTPWRKKYAQEYFGTLPQKTDVLIMGADDEKIDFNNRDSLRKSIRNKYSISDNDFLIVSGGKIDAKKKIHLLMKAVNSCEDKRVKLLIFGNVNDDIKNEFEKQLSEKITYIGWINADSVYDYFFASDLVFFPGQHSVLWEQACAAKVPAVFERWEGMDHVNNGGNSDFIESVSSETILSKIEELLFTPEYDIMKRTALSDKTDIYLYSKIAEKSLECYTEK